MDRAITCDYLDVLQRLRIRWEREHVLKSVFYQNGTNEIIGGKNTEDEREELLHKKQRGICKELK